MILQIGSVPWLDITTSSYQYRKSHRGDKTVVRSSFLHNEISFTGWHLYIETPPPTPLCHRFAHVTTDQLSWRVQNCDLIEILYPCLFTRFRLGDHKPFMKLVPGSLYRHIIPCLQKIHVLGTHLNIYPTDTRALDSLWASSIACRYLWNSSGGEVESGFSTKTCTPAECTINTVNKFSRYDNNVISLQNIFHIVFKLAEKFSSCYEDPAIQKQKIKVLYRTTGVANKLKISTNFHQDIHAQFTYTCVSPTHALWTGVNPLFRKREMLRYNLLTNSV